MFVCLSVYQQDISKKVCYKVSFCENFQQQSCSYIIPLSNDGLWATSPSAENLTHSFRIRRFRQISLNSASGVKASENVQLSIMGSRQCAFHRAIDEPCALHPSPAKSGSKREFLHIFVLPFIYLLQAIVDNSYLVCRLTIARFSLLPTDDKQLFLKWTWARHVNHFKFQGPKHTSKITEARIVKFLTQVGYISNVTKRTTYDPLNGHGYGHVTVLKFCRCRDAARRAGSSATAKLLVFKFYTNHIFVIGEARHFKVRVGPTD